MRDAQPKRVTRLLTLILCVLVSGCTVLHPPPAAPALDVIVVAGQSNAVGFDADPAELPPDPADRDVLFRWRCGDPPPDAHDTASAPGWTTLRPQPRGEPRPSPRPQADRQYGNFALPAGGFGPEIGLARALRRAEPARRLAIVKVAYSGTALRTGWNHDDPGEGGACFRALVQEVSAALADSRATGDAPHLRALVWVQGESDASTTAAPHYPARLESFLGALRAALAAPRLPALLALNLDNGGGRNRFIPEIAAAQRTVAARDPHVAYVDMTGIPVANAAHWSAAGTLLAGERFAAALRAFEAAAPATR
jgi:hypothetical protein